MNRQAQKSKLYKYEHVSTHSQGKVLAKYYESSFLYFEVHNDKGFVKATRILQRAVAIAQGLTFNIKPFVRIYNCVA